MFRYVAFLRGVSPMNLKMVDFKRCLETAGYSNVKTVLSSGNAAFDTSSKSAAVIERQIEATFTKQLGRSFYTIVRSVVRGFLLLTFLAASAASGKNGSTATANDRAVAITEAVKLSPNPCN